MINLFRRQSRRRLVLVIATALVCTVAVPTGLAMATGSGAAAAPSARMRSFFCTFIDSLGKYRCYDGAGDPIDPPAPVCAVSQTRALFACRTGNTPVTPTPTPTVSQGQPLDPRVTASLTAAKAAGLRVWLETDLVAAWKRGPRSATFTGAIARVARAAADPTVIGVQFADEVGFSGFDNEDRVREFMTETSAALRRALPQGKQLAVSVVAPELICGTDTRCKTTVQNALPLVSLRNVESYVGLQPRVAGLVDQVNLSTRDVLTANGVRVNLSAGQAFARQLQTVLNRGWPTRLRVGTRDIALSHVGAAATTTAAVAQALVRLHLDQPLSAGFAGVTLVPFHATSSNGQIRRLLDADNTPRNNVWNALRARTPVVCATCAHRGNARLAIAYNPFDPENGPSNDVKAIADVAGVLSLRL